MTFTAVASSLLGGAIIGLAMTMLLLLRGRVAGVSGIFGGLVFATPGERGWRALFLAGLIAGGLLARLLSPNALGAMGASVPVLALAGVLVGFGTRLGGGCTSGHGVCGISRGSPRSFVATGAFMTIAGVVVFLVRHGAGR
jgi:uncharacterized membrane protein YedE/YeeE